MLLIRCLNIFSTKMTTLQSTPLEVPSTPMSKAKSATAWKRNPFKKNIRTNKSLSSPTLLTTTLLNNNNNNNDDDTLGSSTSSSPTNSSSGNTSTATNTVTTTTTTTKHMHGWLESVHITEATIKQLVITEDNALEALDMLDSLEVDDRLIQALSLLHKLDAFLADHPPSPSSSTNITNLHTLLATPERTARMAVLRERANESLESMNDLEFKEGWIFDHSLFGTDTYHRYEEGGLYVLVDTAVSAATHGPISCFEQLAVIKEADLYSKWSPYCARGAVAKAHSKSDLVNFMIFNMRVLRREVILRTYVCDDSMDSRRFMVVGKTVPRSELPPLEEMPAECYQDCPPMHFLKLRAMIKLNSIDSGRLLVAAKMDFNTRIPRSMVDFGVKRFFQVLPFLIVRAGQAAVRDPVNHPHAVRIREDPYYRQYLLAKYHAFCAHNGWVCPIIPALEIDDKTAGGMWSSSSSSSSSSVPLLATPRLAMMAEEQAKKKKKKGGFKAFKKLFSSSNSKDLSQQKEKESEAIIMPNTQPVLSSSSSFSRYIADGPVPFSVLARQRSSLRSRAEDEQTHPLESRLSYQSVLLVLFLFYFYHAWQALLEVGVEGMVPFGKEFALMTVIILGGAPLFDKYFFA